MRAPRAGVAHCDRGLLACATALQGFPRHRVTTRVRRRAARLTKGYVRVEDPQGSPVRLPSVTFTKGPSTRQLPTFAPGTCGPSTSAVLSCPVRCHPCVGLQWRRCAALRFAGASPGVSGKRPAGTACARMTRARFKRIRKDASIINVGRYRILTRLAIACTRGRAALAPPVSADASKA